LRDQIARDDKEDIDADKPAGKPAHPGVEQHHREHRDRPQAIDFRAINPVATGRVSTSAHSSRS